MTMTTEMKTERTTAGGTAMTKVKPTTRSKHPASSARILATGLTATAVLGLTSVYALATPSFGTAPTNGQVPAATMTTTNLLSSLLSTPTTQGNQPAVQAQGDVTASQQTPTSTPAQTTPAPAQAAPSKPKRVTTVQVQAPAQTTPSLPKQVPVQVPAPAQAPASNNNSNNSSRSNGSH